MGCVAQPPYMGERGQHVIRHQRPLVPAGVRERVVPDHVLQVRGVEVDNVVEPVLRNGVCDFLRQIAVRIDYAKAPPEVEQFENNVFEQHGFSGAGFSDNVKMPTNGVG